MKAISTSIALATLTLAGAASAQEATFKNSTVVISVAGACTTSPNSAKQVTQCQDLAHIYFTGSGKIYMFYPNTRDEGIQFDLGRKTRTTTIQKYNSQPRKVPVDTSSALSGNVFTMSYQFNNRGAWPDGQALVHRQMWGTTIQFDGSGGCSVTAYAFAKVLESGSKLLDDRVQRGFATQSCRVVAGRA